MGFPFSHGLTGSLKSECPMSKQGNENPWSAFLNLASVQIIVSHFTSPFPFISGYFAMVYASF